MNYGKIWSESKLVGIFLDWQRRSSLKKSSYGFLWFKLITNPFSIAFIVLTTEIVLND